MLTMTKIADTSTTANQLRNNYALLDRVRDAADTKDKRSLKGSGVAATATAADSDSIGLKASSRGHECRSDISAARLPPTQKKSVSQTQVKVGSTIKVRDSRRLASPPVQGFHCNINISSPKLVDRKTKMRKFREHVKSHAASGQLFQESLDSIHAHLLHKELAECSVDSEPACSPLDKHNITKEYRTKMTDWMVEVCTSFKCSKRSYFLAVRCFDRYLMIMRKKGVVLTNKDVHCIGVTAMYLASKYEDIYPLHSKIVSEKIAHKAISAKEILTKEAEFLLLLDFQVDLVTHFDLHETIVDKLKFKLKGEPAFKLITEMSMLLTKMALQCVDFAVHSPSIVVAASFLAAINIRQKKLSDDEFCSKAKDAVLEMVQDDQNTVAGHEELKQRYRAQFSADNLAAVAEQLEDFFRRFDDWHCGLNQLKRFNKVPYE